MRIFKPILAIYRFDAMFDTESGLPEKESVLPESFHGISGKMV